MSEAQTLEYPGGCGRRTRKRSRGYRGTFSTPFQAGTVGLSSLVPQVADAILIPVIAFGGVMDGRGIVAATILGASAVQMGTVFPACDEAGVSDAYKTAIMTAPMTIHALHGHHRGPLLGALLTGFCATTRAGSAQFCRLLCRMRSRAPCGRGPQRTTQAITFPSGVGRVHEWLVLYQRHRSLECLLMKYRGRSPASVVNDSLSQLFVGRCLMDEDAVSPTNLTLSPSPEESPKYEPLHNRERETGCPFR